MDAVEKRVQDRMALEARQARDEQMKLGKRRKAVAREVDKALTAATKLFDVLQAGDAPTKAVAGVGDAAIRALPKHARTLVSVNEQMGALTTTLATLDEPAERERRLKDARELGVTDKPLTGLDAAEMVLIRRGKATHVTDITREVLETGLVKLAGKTPDQTMSASLAKVAAKHDGKFVRVAPGIFDLRERETAKV